MAACFFCFCDSARDSKNRYTLIYVRVFNDKPVSLKCLFTTTIIIVVFKSNSFPRTAFCRINAGYVIVVNKALRYNTSRTGNRCRSKPFPRTPSPPTRTHISAIVFEGYYKNNRSFKFIKRRTLPAQSAEIWVRRGTRLLLIAHNHYRIRSCCRLIIIIIATTHHNINNGVGVGVGVIFASKYENIRLASKTTTRTRICYYIMLWTHE